MSSKRDLVEANAFSRRRLVTAFVSGAPGGREVEPVRPARTVVGGLALGVLMIAGAAIASIFAGRAPADWLAGGNIVVSNEATTYVVVAEDEPLQPVINMTSARLILGQDAEQVSVDQELIDEQDLDPMIGIFGAPTSLPSTGNLQPTGWTSCVHEQQGVMFHIGDDPAVTPADGAVGLVVADGSGQRHLIAQSQESDGGFHRYRLPKGTTGANTVLNGLGLNTAAQFVVAREWLRLFPDGGDLDLSTFGSMGGTARAPYADDLGRARLKVGDLVSDGQQTYLAGPEELHPLTEFALAVYEKVRRTSGVTQVDDISVPSTALPALQSWPAQLPEAFEGGTDACAVLDAGAGRAPRTMLARDPSAGESAEEVDAGAIEVSVAPGLGAYVLSGAQGATSGGSPMVIDMDSKRYRLGGPAGETAGLLGYGGYEPPTVPEAWTESFSCGPELSQEAALRVPDPDALEGCRSGAGSGGKDAKKDGA